jgi:hypothetical protein
MQRTAVANRKDADAPAGSMTGSASYVVPTLATPPYDLTIRLPLDTIWRPSQALNYFK